MKIITEQLLSLLIWVVNFWVPGVLSRIKQMEVECWDSGLFKIFVYLFTVSVTIICTTAMLNTSDT